MRAIRTSLLLLLILACLPAALPAQSTEPQQEDDAPPDNKLANPPGVVDKLVLFDSPEAWQAGELERVQVQEGNPPHLLLTDARTKAFPKSGRYTTTEYKTQFPFTELLPSWNLSTSPDTGAAFHVRVRDVASGEWSPYLYVGQWGRTLHAPDRTLGYDGGEIHIDYLKLKQPADAFQMRATLYSFSIDESTTPTLRRLAASYSGVVADEARRKALLEPVIVDGNWARSLPIRFRAQGRLDPSISGSTCSPTSVSMVMDYYGIDNPNLQNAMRIYDPEYGIFGVWSKATALPSEYGLDGWVRRYRDWNQVKAEIAAGHPVIASIRFRRGEFPSNPLKRTGGHLIVIRGFTPEGDVIVNDPAHRDLGDGIVYKADELARAWFDKGGVAYLITRPPEQ